MLYKDQCPVKQRKKFQGYPPSHLLWFAYETSPIRGPQRPYKGHRASYWLRPSIRVLPLPYTQADGPEQFHRDLIPFKTLILMGREKSREVLGCISAKIAPSGNITGFEVCFVERDGPAGVAKYLGRLDPGYQNFEINVAAGEHITEVHISGVYSQRAVRVRLHYSLLLTLSDSNSSRRISAGRSVLERDAVRNGQFSVLLKARL